MTFTWSNENIESEKSQIKKLLDGVSKDPEDRLFYVLEQLTSLQDSTDPQILLRRYYLALNALLIHIQKGGLTESKVNGLIEMAHSILTAQRIEPFSSKLSFLYEELHMIRGQASRKDGQHWASAWEHQIAQLLPGKHARIESGIHHLIMGNRLFRLGYLSQALKSFEEAFLRKDFLNASQLAQVMLGRIKAHRLRGDYDEAMRCIEEFSKAESILSDAMKLEIEWESMCLEICKTGDVKDILKSASSSGRHRDATYVVEAFFWKSVVKKAPSRFKIPAMRTIIKYEDMDTKSLGLFYKAAVALERCYDEDLPVVRKLENLRDILIRTSELITIDKELLVWAAAARWLHQVNYRGLENLALQEYKQLSKRLSDGKTEDSLGVLSDCC